MARNTGNPPERTAYQVTTPEGRTYISEDGPDTGRKPGYDVAEVRGYNHPNGSGFVITSEH